MIKLVGFVIFTSIITICAAFTPWWGTPIIVAISYFVFRLPVRALAFATFIGWAMAAFARDFNAEFGPSRVFAKMLSLNSFGLTLGSPADDFVILRFWIYFLVGMIGFLFALSVGSISKAVSELWVSIFPKTPRAGTSAD